MVAEIRANRKRRVRARVLARDGNRCVECGSPDDLTLDHVIPKALGGTNAQDNLQTLCEPCNNRKGSKVNGRRFPLLKAPVEVPYTVLALFGLSSSKAGDE